MTLTSAQMRELEAQSSDFGENHCTYLAEAINTLRTSGQPQVALQLLAALASGARDDQSAALRDVRRWLERRLGQQPRVSSEQLLLELGWLRRMCIARTAGGSSGDGSSHPPPRKRGWARSRPK